MTKKLLFVGTILLLVVCVANAADISGKWTMSQPARNGGPPRVTTFDLKVDGTILTGTVTAPMGGRVGATAQEPAPIAIANGKVNGNTVTFDVVRTFAGNSATTKYEGAVSGGTMHIKQTIDLGNGPLTVQGDAKRATP